MLYEYYTVKQHGTHEIFVQKSRFITALFPSDREEKALQQIEMVRKKHKTANHHCFAYRIGRRGEIQKASDDGEPSGTAGIPILEVLKKRGLTNTTAVVTRYFGGIKLGTGGLIRAYSNAVREGLKTTGIVKRKKMNTYFATVPYSLVGKVEHELRQQFEVVNIEYHDSVTFHVVVLPEQNEVFLEFLRDFTRGAVDVKRGPSTFREIEIE